MSKPLLAMWWLVLEGISIDEAAYGFRVVARSTQYGDVEPAHILEIIESKKHDDAEAMIAKINYQRRLDREKQERSRDVSSLASNKGSLSDEERARNRDLVAGLISKIAGLEAGETKKEDQPKWRWDESVDFSKAHEGIIRDSLYHVKN